MLNIVNKIKINGSVLDLKIAKDRVIVVDNIYYLYLLDAHKLQFVKTVTVSKKHEEWHKYTKSFSISSDAYANVPLFKTSKSVILNCKDGVERVSTITWHKSDLSASSFSEDGEYFASGGEDGKTVIYQKPSFNMLTLLPPKPDYISNITFSNDSKFIAASSFDKSTTVFDLERNQELGEFIVDDIVEKSLFFDNNKKLFFVCKDGKSGIYGVEEGKVLSLGLLHKSWLTFCALSFNENYALCGGKENMLFLVRLSDNKLIQAIKVDHYGVSYIRFYKKRLFVGYVDGIVEIIDCDKFNDELEIALKVNDFTKAKELTKKNIFLSINNQLIETLDKAWEESLRKIIDLIAKNKIEEALAVATPFLDDPVKNEEFTHYMSQKDYVGEFLEAIEEKNIVGAYELAQKHPEIKKLSAFEELEEYWIKLFNTAKKLLASNPTLNLNKATEILKVFAQIKSKKDQILTLLRNSDKYIAADQALKERNFALYFRLGEQFPFLKETDTYKKTMLVGEQLIERISVFEGKEEFRKAIEFGKVLANMAPFKHLAIERIRFIERKISFLEAFKEKDYVKAYAIVEASSDLKALPQFSDLLDLFKECSHKALDCAFLGDPKGAYSSLEEYHNVTYWKDKIGSIMKIAYLNEIKNATSNYQDDDIDWVRTFNFYIDRYGKDDEIERISQEIKKSFVLDSINDKGDVAGYLKHEYVDTILVFL